MLLFGLLRLLRLLVLNVLDLWLAFLVGLSVLLVVGIALFHLRALIDLALLYPLLSLILFLADTLNVSARLVTLSWLATCIA